MVRFECQLCLTHYGARRDAFRHVRAKHPGMSDRDNVVEVDEAEIDHDNVVPAGQQQPVRRPAPPPLLATAPAPAQTSSYPPLSPVFSRPLYNEPVISNLATGQLRSSRSTRNQEHNPAARNRAGLPDFDPTDGLPVRRFELQTVRINQDAAVDAGEVNNQASEANENYPWPELPLPSFFAQLPALNQELIRRSRRGNVNAKISIWDSKAGTYIPGIELERREAARKAAMSKPKSATAAAADLPEEDDDKVPDDEAEDLLDADGMPEKRRKTGAAGSGDRIIEVRKWVPVPAAVAEKMPEPKYLADRRPGMESLYKGAYKATNGFGTLGDMVAAAMSGGATGYDLGDGGGLGNAQSLLAPGSGSANWNGGSGAQTDGATTPVRKNMPPRRKKKGGPGRKPKNWKPETATSATEATTAAATTGDSTTTKNTAGVTATGEGDTTMTDTAAASGEHINDTDKGEPAAQGESNTQDQDGEGSESESEGEGSEEGEIGAPHPPADAPVHEAVAGNVVPEVETATKPETEMQKQMETETTVEPATAETEPEGAPAEKEAEETEEPEKMEIDEKPAEEEDLAAAPDAEVFEPIPAVEEDDEPETSAEEVPKEVDVLGALEAALDKEAGQDD